MKKINFKLLLIILLAVLLIGESAYLVLSSKKVESNTMVEQEQQGQEHQKGLVRGYVLTDNGHMSNAAVIIEDEQGNRERVNCNFLSGFSFYLNPGKYKLHFTRGIEFSIVTKEVTVKNFSTINIEPIRLVQLYDSYNKGWVAGDLHQHSTWSDGANRVDEVFLSNINTGLYYGFLSDHNSAMGLSQWTNGDGFVAFTDEQATKRNFNAFESVEVTTEFGHYQSLGVGMTFDQYEVILRDRERNLPKEEKYRLILDRVTYIAREIKRAGGVAQINHMFSSSTMGYSYWETLEEFDTIEIWNGVFHPGDGRYEGEYKGQNYKSKMKWFEFLNDIKNGGKYLPATGGTDNHDIESKYVANVIKDDAMEIEDIDDYKYALEFSGKYSGQPTTYIHIPEILEEELTLEKTLSAIKSGHSFISNGPIVIADINGVSYGDTVTIKGNSATLNIEAFCRDELTDIRIVKNGEISDVININDVNYKSKYKLSNLKDGDWIVLEGLGADINYAITNPIFIKK